MSQDAPEPSEGLSALYALAERIADEIVRPRPDWHQIATDAAALAQAATQRQVHKQ